MHDGGTTGPPALDPNGCDGLTGAILDLNNRIDPSVDLLMTGLTHAAYRCLLPVPGGEPRLVTQAGSHGRMVTDIQVTLDRATGDVDRAATYTATNVPVTRDAPDARVQSIVDYWTAGPSNQPAAGTPGAVASPGNAAAPSAQSQARLLGVLALLGVAVVVIAWVVLHRRARRAQFGIPVRRRNPLRFERPRQPRDETPVEKPETAPQ
jgi:5'-nucleotidase